MAVDFQPFHRRDGTGGDGVAMLIRGGLSWLMSWIRQRKNDGILKDIGNMAPGFSSGGTIQQQGLEIRWIESIPV